MKLRNKICLVTGAASGLGKAIAARFAQEGARVAIADLNKAQAQAVADEIKGLGVAMDVTSEEQVNRGVAEVASKWGGVDVLVSNAGIQIVHPVEEFPYADWKKRRAIHLDGAFLTTRACVPHMKRSGRGGSIIYMGSVHSKEASVLKSAYVTAKHGLIGPHHLDRHAALVRIHPDHNPRNVCAHHVLLVSNLNSGWAWRQASRGATVRA